MWRWINGLWAFLYKRTSSSETNAQKRGRYGESVAARWLRQQKGYTILARNWRQGRDELDLICRDGRVIVFIEVKTRKADPLVPGYASVTRRKKAALRRVAKHYLRGLRPAPKHFRFDIVEVQLMEKGGFKVCHYENALLFSKYFHLDDFAS